MTIQITNGLISAKVNSKGAELTSLFNHATNLEHMWGADPKFWAKTSPVLFPIVGALKEGAFLYRNNSYKLSRHGFARDMEFTVEVKEPSRVVFLLTNTDETKKLYPFTFELRIIYSVDQFTLTVSYEVTNKDADLMYFSLGAHPAFKVPLVPGTSYNDYQLLFNRKENSGRWPITKDGLLETSSEPCLQSDVLPLTKDLFYKDALVFKDVKSTMISIRSSRHTHGIDFSFEGFPYFGIWAAPDADFVCLEPWCGVADSTSHDQLLEHKEGIQKLSGLETWKRSWSVKCY
jgi:galactose mutarotase-like enzyme